MTPARRARFGSDFKPDPNSLELISSTPIKSAQHTPPLPSTSPYVWRMQRNLCGHDLMQKITSPNRQKRNDSKPLQPAVAGAGEKRFGPIPMSLKTRME